MSCTETSGAVPRTVPCLAQVEGGPAPLGSGGWSVSLEASHHAVTDNVGHTKKTSSSMSPIMHQGKYKWNTFERHVIDATVLCLLFTL